MVVVILMFVVLWFSVKAEEAVEWIDAEVEVYADIEWSACTSLQECSFVATQACWSHRVEVEALSFDSTSSKNGCSWICANDRAGRVDCKATGTAQKPRCPESWCGPDYVGPRHPCCDAPDDDDAAKDRIEWLLPGGWSQ